MLYLYDILNSLSLGPYLRQFDLLVSRCLWDIRNRDMLIWRLTPRLASPRDRIPKLCHNGIMNTLNSCSEASKGDRRYAPGVAAVGVCMRPLQVKMEPTYEDERQAVSVESNDT